MIKRHAERDESLNMPFVLRETNYLLSQQCGVVKNEEFILLPSRWLLSPSEELVGELLQSK